MADYLLHLIEVKLTSVFCADDSAGSTPIMQKIVPERHWSSTLTRPIKEPNRFIRPRRQKQSFQSTNWK